MATPISSEAETSGQGNRRRLTIMRLIRWGLPLFLTLLVVAYGGVSIFMAGAITKAERKDFVNSPAEYGLEYEDIEFPSRRGDVTLSGWHIPGDGETGPAVIFVHGLGGNRAGDNDLRLARRLVDQGFAVLLFDLRGHGRSQGELVSAGYYEKKDVLGAFDFLVGLGIPSDRIGIHGFSMGAATALLAAGDEPLVRGVVSDSAFADVSDLIVQETAGAVGVPQSVVPPFIPGMKLMANLLHGISLGAIVPEDAVTGLDYQALLIHGMEDTRIPSEHSVRIHRASPPGSDLWLVPDVGHTEAFSTHPEEYVDGVTSYFRTRFGEE